MRLKIATWNVNGIRARQAQFCDWLARDQPDVVCLQELKAEPGQIPEPCKVADYVTFWHGMRAYSGVSLHIRKSVFETSRSSATRRSTWNRASCRRRSATWCSLRSTCPTAARTIAAKVRFMTQLIAWAREPRAQGRELILCGDMNITRTEMDVHPKERKPGIIGQRPEERELFASLLENLVDVGRKLDPDNAEHVHLVGAVAEHAPAQHRLAPGLRARLARRSRRARRAARCWPRSAPATTRR